LPILCIFLLHSTPVSFAQFGQFILYFTDLILCQLCWLINECNTTAYKAFIPHLVIPHQQLHNLISIILVISEGHSCRMSIFGFLSIINKASIFHSVLIEKQQPSPLFTTFIGGLTIYCILAVWKTTDIGDDHLDSTVLLYNIYTFYINFCKSLIACVFKC